MKTSRLGEVLEIAENEVGYKEKASNAMLDNFTLNAGTGNYTKYARDLDALEYYNTPKNGYAWCAVFVDWCLFQIFGSETKSRKYQGNSGLGASCTATYNMFKAAGKISSEPTIGSQVFFYDPSIDSSVKTHTGLVYSISGNSITVIEGNADHAVMHKTYKVSDKKIAGYGLIDYMVEEPGSGYTADDVTGGAPSGDVGEYDFPVEKRKLIVKIPRETMCDVIASIIHLRNVINACGDMLENAAVSEDEITFELTETGEIGVDTYGVVS